MTDITATVGPESKPEPYLTIYAVQQRGRPTLLTPGGHLEVAEIIAKGIPCARIVTIPGSDTPSPWKPASEPPASNRRVLLWLPGNTEPLYVGRYEHGAWMSIDGRYPVPRPPSHWAELPPPRESPR